MVAVKKPGKLRQRPNECAPMKVGAHLLSRKPDADVPLAPVFDLRGWVNPVREVVMEGQWPELTMDELRARIKVAGVQIAEARLEMIRGLVNMALAPVRMADSRAMKTLEPATTFDVSRNHLTSDRGPDDVG